jgi:hypothetical protein
MARQRKDEFAYEIKRETTINTEPSWTTPLVGTISSTDLDSIANSAVEDPAYTVDGGTHEEVVGVSHTNVAVPLSLKQEGLQAVAADAAPAVATAQTLAISTAMGQVETLTTRSKVTAADASSSTEDQNDGHLPGGGDGTIGIAAFARAADGTIHSRPYTYDAATDKMTHLMALPNPQAVDDIIYAGALMQYVERPDFSSSPPSASVRFLGNSQKQNRSIQGVVSQIAVPEHGPQDVPMLDFTLAAMGQQRNVSFTANGRVATARTNPTNPRGRVFAGGEILIGAYGQTDYISVAGRISWNIRRDGWLPYEDGNNGDGISSWDSGKGNIDVNIILDESIDPSVLTGITQTSFYDCWKTGGAESLFHIFYSSGQAVAGAGQDWYFPAVRLLKPPDAEANEQAARNLPFRAATPLSSTENAAVCQQW